MKKLVKYGILSLCLLTLGGLIDSPSVLGVGGSTVLASETAESAQMALDSIRTKKDEVLGRLRQLLGNEEAERLFDRRFAELRNLETNPDIVAQKDRLLKRLDTELFRLDLIEDVYAEMTAYYVTIQQPNPWTALDLYQGKEIFKRADSMTDRRYIFSEASLTTIPGNSYQVYRLANDSNENNLIASHDELIKFFKEATATSDLMLEFRHRYNELIRYFNAQPEDVRKEQYREFAKERLSAIYYEVTQTLSPYKAERIREELKRLDYRVKGNVITQAQRDQIMQTIANKKAAVLEELQKLPYIDLTQIRTEYMDVTARGLNRDLAYRPDLSLNRDATPEEAKQFQERRLREWEQFLSKLKLIDSFFERINKVEKQYGVKGVKKYIVSDYGRSAAAETAVGAKTLPKNTSDREFLADKIEISRYRAYAPLNSIYDIAYSDMSDAAAFSQLVDQAEESVSLFEQRYGAQVELVAAYNKLIDKINALPKEIRRERWLKLVYQENPSLYLPTAIELSKVDTLESLETTATDLRNRMLLFERTYLGGTSPSRLSDTSRTTTSSSSTTVKPSSSTVASSSSTRVTAGATGTSRPTGTSNLAPTVVASSASSSTSADLSTPSSSQSGSENLSNTSATPLVSSDSQSVDKVQDQSQQPMQDKVTQLVNRVLPKTGDASVMVIVVGVLAFFSGFGLACSRPKK